MLILDSIIHWAGVVDELDFAKRLHMWSNKGFKELGDSDGFVVCNTISKVKSFKTKSDKRWKLKLFKICSSHKLL